MEETGVKRTWHTSFERVKTETNLRLPGLPYLGFAFWFGWNLIAFSGTTWCTSENTGIYITYLYIIHLLLSVGVNLFFAFTARRLFDLITSNAFPLIGAGIGCAGTACMVIVGQELVESLPLFIFGSALAGVGTSFMLVRSATVYGTVNPHKSLLNMCLSVLVAIATYYFVSGSGSILGPILFCLIPAVAAAALLVRIPTHEERRLGRADITLPSQFISLNVAIFFYSLTVSVVNRFSLTSLPASQSVACMGYVMFGLMMFSLVIILLRLVWPDAVTINTIFYPIALMLIIGVAAIPFVSNTSLGGAALIDFAGYAFDIMVWMICPYLAYQLKGGCIKLMCLGTVSMSAGLVTGSTVALFLLHMGISQGQFLPVVAVLTLASLVMTVLVFPDKKLQELILPPEQEELAETTTVAARRARWREACASLAEEHKLTERETQVMELLSKGYSAQQVADELVVSVYTARAHIRNLHGKLGITSNKEIPPLVEARRDEL